MLIFFERNHKLPIGRNIGVFSFRHFPNQQLTHRTCAKKRADKQCLIYASAELKGVFLLDNRTTGDDGSIHPYSACIFPFAPYFLIPQTFHHSNNQLNLPSVFVRRRASLDFGMEVVDEACKHTSEPSGISSHEADNNKVISLVHATRKTHRSITKDCIFTLLNTHSGGNLNFGRFRHTDYKERIGLPRLDKPCGTPTCMVKKSTTVQSPVLRLFIILLCHSFKSPLGKEADCESEMC